VSLRQAAKHSRDGTPSRPGTVRLFAETSAVAAPGARVTFINAATRAAPAFISAAIALAGSADILKLPSGSVPVRLGAVLAALAAGFGLTSMFERSGARPYWLIGLCTTLILMPIVALQASASRVPFVGIARGSAGPLLWLTFATFAAMIGIWLLVCHQSGGSPEDAALLVLPAAVLVPAMLGAEGALGESSALRMLGESSLVAGGTIFLGLLSPPHWRPAAGGAALGAQFLLLWAMGRGPVIGQDGGFIVPACTALVLALTVLLTVLAPLGALFGRRFSQTVEEESGESRPASIPPKGARRRSD
jgi:hypothetical protein